MSVRVHMDDTWRMVNRKTKTDTNPIPDPNRYSQHHNMVLSRDDRVVQICFWRLNF